MHKKSNQLSQGVTSPIIMEGSMSLSIKDCSRSDENPSVFDRLNNANNFLFKLDNNRLSYYTSNDGVNCDGQMNINNIVIPDRSAV